MHNTYSDSLSLVLINTLRPKLTHWALIFFDNQTMSRINTSDSIEVALAKIAGGTQGATSALANIVEKGPYVDPEMETGGIGHILLLD